MGAVHFHNKVLVTELPEIGPTVASVISAPLPS